MISNPGACEAINNPVLGPESFARWFLKSNVASKNIFEVLLCRRKLRWVSKDPGKRGSMAESAVDLSASALPVWVCF